MYALLVAQDPDDVAIFSLVLQRAGLAVTTVKELERAMQNWPERPADLILLALSGSIDPDEQVRQVRAETLVPLILVLPAVDEDLHCELLKRGADLVVTPPVSAKLLMAQVGVLMRRTGNLPGFSLPALEIAGLAVDPTARTLDIAGKPTQRLTHLEFRLLYTLIINRGHVVPTEMIVERVWGYTGQGHRDLVRGLVSRLRVKVERNPRDPEFILTVPGIGYLFAEDDG